MGAIAKEKWWEGLGEELQTDIESFYDVKS